MISCPSCSSEMILTAVHKNILYRNVDIDFDAEVYMCIDCGLEAATIEQAGRIQREILIEYTLHLFDLEVAE